MPRNISFALTTRQFRDKSKRVTRRLKWLNVKAGDQLMGCVKCMGLKPGEQIERLGLIEVTDARREPLDAMLSDMEYGDREAALEGFPEMTAVDFVSMFCHHMKCVPSLVITRIAYDYVTPPVCCCGAWADPDGYPGAMWDRSEDHCPVHSPMAKK